MSRGEGAKVQLMHRGKSKTLSNKQRRWLKRRQAIEPLIGHVKHDQRHAPLLAQGESR